MREDIKYAIRNLAKSPGFLVVAVLSLAVGIGANTAIFTLTNAAFLTGLPVEDLSRLVEVWGVNHLAAASTRGVVSLPNYEDLRDRNQVFSGVAAYSGATVIVTGRGEPKPLYTLPVTANYFDVLGVRTILGRSFSPEEDRESTPVVVLSYTLWRNEFGGDARVIGQTVDLNSTPFTVIGVAPPGFRGTFDIMPPKLVWVPLSTHTQVLPAPQNVGLQDRRVPQVMVFGRLKAGVSQRQALANVQTVATQLEREYPEANRGRAMELSPLSEAALPVYGWVRGAMVLTAVVALVLLIACLNLANLLLARSARRAVEMGIRAALGASRMRIVRHVLTENVLLAAAGGLAGLLVGWFGSPLLWSLRPSLLDENSISVRLDLHVFVFTAAASLLTVLLFGLAPAIHSAAADLNSILKAGARGGTDRRSDSWRGLLVVSQIALSLVGLVGAGLFIRSFQRAEAVNPGFETQSLFLFRFDLTPRRYTPEQGRALLQTMIRQAQSTPGVRAAALASTPPFTSDFSRWAAPEGEDVASKLGGVLTTINAVSPAYFETMRIPLLEGRAFTELDRDGSQPVAVMSHSLARRFWPEQEAIGHRFRLANENFYRTVIGVAADITPIRAGYLQRPVAYLPLDQNYQPNLSLVARTATNPSSALEAGLANVQRLDPDLALTDAKTMPELVAQGMYGPRAGAALFGILGLLGLALAVLGIYGVMAYMVAQRTNEIGIRMALGARPANILQMVVGQAARMILAGIVLGVVAALAFSRWIASLLFGIGGQDLLTFCVVSLALAGAALIAAWVPARRAAHIDPLRALRQD